MPGVRFVVLSHGRDGRRYFLSCHVSFLSSHLVDERRNEYILHLRHAIAVSVVKTILLDTYACLLCRIDSHHERRELVGESTEG